MPTDKVIVVMSGQARLRRVADLYDTPQGYSCGERPFIRAARVHHLLADRAVEAGARAGVDLAHELYGGEETYDQLSDGGRLDAQHLARVTIRAAITAAGGGEG